MENYTGKCLGGRYEIHEVIGVGGMAVVYKAYDNIDDRTVAVKILKEEYIANEEFRRRFKNESKAIAVLSHPNIVKVYDVSYGDRLQYIVMEYVEGITLKEYIEQQGKLQIREAVHFTMQILRALQHAHDKGIVHRDIKPQNILLLSNGNIKVTDFGIARFSNESKTLTESAIGSVHYISPEQARGDTIDDKTDIYAVGVVLYEMLTGKVPFESNSSVSVALMQLSKDPVPPRKINPEIPEGLEYIIMHAMQKNVLDRYQSAAEMLLDIEEFKRNPSVKFRENYFVDSDPTKTINLGGSIPASRQIINERVSEKKYAPETDYSADKRTPIIKGIIFSIVALALIVFAAFYFGTTKFNGSKLTVPNLIGKNYALDIAGNNDYSKFEIEVDYVQNSTYEDGMVITQDPKAGLKVDKRKNKIVISVASTVEMVPVPDVVGSSYVEAKKILEIRGFKVIATPQTSGQVEFGTVIRTDPVSGTNIEEGANITIYYASDSELIPVPNLKGWDIGTAKTLLESVGLVLDETGTIYEDNTAKYGTIVGQDIEPDEKVEAGSRVAVILSNGNAPTTTPASSTAYISFNLPSTGATGTVSATLNGSVVLDKSTTLDGSSYSFSVDGSGSSNLLKVLVNGETYYTCDIDFTVSPANISGQQYRSSGSSSTRAQMPSVKGYTENSAKEALKAAGFYNVYVTTANTDNPMSDGVVISQSPEASSGGIFSLGYSTDTQVMLTVGKYVGDTNEDAE